MSIINGKILNQQSFSSMNMICSLIEWDNYQGLAYALRIEIKNHHNYYADIHDYIINWDSSGQTVQYMDQQHGSKTFTTIQKYAQDFVSRSFKLITFM